VSGTLARGLTELPVREIAGGVSAGTLSAEAVTRAFLARVAERDGAIGAWHYLAADEALAEARTIDALPGALPLKGVPIGVKDVMDTADLPTGYGSAAYEGSRPVADAACVALARAAGAVVLGKTVSTEFAAASPGKTANPHDPAHTPGGSSSGSAAAVAAGMVPLAFGTQTAGSIIRPASYCGVVGYKPSFGLIDRSGVKTLADSLDTVGLFACTVADAAWFAAALSGRPALATARAPRVPRVGLYDAANWDALDPACAAALRRAAQALASAGAETVALPRHPLHEALVAAQQTLMDWEVPRALTFERTRLWDRLTPVTQAFISRPQPEPAAYDAARALVGAARADLATATAGVDAWLAPAAPGPAPAGLGSTGDAIHNRLWTALHCPCLSIPCISVDGLPVGVQLIAASDDATALALAAFLEAALLEAAPKET
jgi:amidase